MLRHLVVATALLAASVPVRAQGALTLADALDLALARNPAVHAARAGEEEAAARVRQARSAFLPRVDLVEALQGGNQPVYVFGGLLSQQRFTAANFAIDALNRPDALTNHRAAVVVEQSLYDGSRSQAAYSASQIGAELAREEARRTALDVYQETVRAYGRAAAAAATEAAALAAAESAAGDLRRAEARRDAGFETEAAVLALRVEVADADVRRIQAAADAANARAALNVVIGAPIDDRRPLAVLPDAPAMSMQTAALESSALDQRPEVVQARLRQRLAEIEISGARSGLLPHVAAQASLEANGHSMWDRAGAWTAGIQVRWNAFAGGGDGARIGAAKAAAARAAAERERVEQAVRLDVRQALAAYDSAVGRRGAARAMVEQAAESRRIVRERYEAGLASAADLTRANELVVRADAAQVAALVDVHISAAAVKRAAGALEGR